MIDVRENIPGARNFTWHEALWLPQWKIHAVPDERISNNIIKTAAKMEIIRFQLRGPIFVHSWLRPQVYNKLVGGSGGSSHIEGLAVDFHAERFSCDEVRDRLEPLLDHLEIRMEKNPGSSWVHIDLRQPGVTGRYFIP